MARLQPCRSRQLHCPIVHFEPPHEQHRMMLITVDLKATRNWELNFAFGLRMTAK